MYSASQTQPVKAPRAFRAPSTLFVPGGSLWVAMPEQGPSDAKAERVLKELIKRCRKARTVSTDITDAELARILGWSIRSLQRRIQMLDDERFIERKRRNGRRTITLLFRLAAKEQPSAKACATDTPPVAARINTREEREENAEPAGRTANRPTVSAGEAKAEARSGVYGNPPTPIEDIRRMKEPIEDPVRTAAMLATHWRLWTDDSGAVHDVRAHVAAAGGAT